MVHTFHPVTGMHSAFVVFHADRPVAHEVMALPSPEFVALSRFVDCLPEFTTVRVDIQVRAPAVVQVPIDTDWPASGKSKGIELIPGDIGEDGGLGDPLIATHTQGMLTDSSTVLSPKRRILFFV